ncbi:hypothetical protein J3A83DRAFT_1079295 [Scleroderma citrinum]
MCVVWVGFALLLSVVFSLASHPPTLSPVFDALCPPSREMASPARRYECWCLLERCASEQAYVLLIDIEVCDCWHCAFNGMGLTIGQRARSIFSSFSGVRRSVLSSALQARENLHVVWGYAPALDILTLLSCSCRMTH